MKRFLAGYAMLAVAATFITVAQAPQLPIDEDAVIAEMEALIDSTPDTDPSARERSVKLLRKGVKAHDAQRFDEAIELYRAALEFDPLSATTYYELSFSYGKMGKKEAALDAIIRALVLDPKEELHYITKANTLDDLGFRDLALEVYRDLLDLQPESYFGHLNYGVTLTRSGAYEQAESAYLRCIEINPEFPSAYFQVASLYRILGYDYDERVRLQEFIDLGKSDPRHATAQKRLDTLNEFTVEIDPDHPYPEIHMTEELARITWKSTTHRETFPEARGYKPTFEEDKDVYSLVLKMWRDEKDDDPSAQFGSWDLLLRIDDAGFLDEYIWYVLQNTVGDRATNWLHEHEQRVEAFLDWARSEGLLNEEPEEPTSTAAIDRYRGYPADVLKLIEESDISYTIDTGDESTNTLLQDERARFASLELQGNDRVSCARVSKKLDEDMAANGARALIAALRCFTPGEEEYEQAVLRAASLGLELREITFRPAGRLEFGEGARVEVMNLPWLAYLVTKAAWRMEHGFRVNNGGPENGDRPSLAEEFLVAAVTAGGYANGLEPDEGEEGVPEEPEHDPALDRLLEAIEANQFRGYVLYEIIHKAYGLRLDRLNSDDAVAVDDYLFGHVIYHKNLE